MTRLFYSLGFLYSIPGIHTIFSVKGYIVNIWALCTLLELFNSVVVIHTQPQTIHKRMDVSVLQQNFIYKSRLAGSIWPVGCSFRTQIFPSVNADSCSAHTSSHPTLILHFCLPLLPMLQNLLILRMTYLTELHGGSCFVKPLGVSYKETKHELPKRQLMPQNH